MLEVSKAIIYQHNDYLLQLRDHTPGIVYAGVWSFFGGAIEARETPWQALQRELATGYGRLSLRLGQSRTSLPYPFLYGSVH